MRIVGVVVAIDEYYGRRIYTVDDSTGECIECSLEIPKQTDSGRQNDVDNETTTATAAATPNAQSKIDVGMVIEVKGSTKIFRDQKQIKVQKLQRIRATSQEVEFWNKIRDFRNDVVSRPWVLEKKEVRRCKKQYMADVDAEEKKRKKRKGNGYDVDVRHPIRQSSTKSEDTRNKPTKQEPLTKARARDSYAHGGYDALGL